jgi:hypothetical protein
MIAKIQLCRLFKRIDCPLCAEHNIGSPVAFDAGVS